MEILIKLEGIMDEVNQSMMPCDGYQRLGLPSGAAGLRVQASERI